MIKKQNRLEIYSFITERGKILLRHITCIATKYQRKLVIAIKCARHMALLPVVNVGSYL